MHVENPASWGVKRLCQDCKAKYFDLRRSPVVCPKCGAEFVEPPKSKRAASSAAGARARAGSSGHTSGPWANRAGAHSPFAESHGRAADDGETADEGEKAESDKSAESEEREHEEETSA